MTSKKYCVRCGHEMWYDETKKRWYCTNPDCVKYYKPSVQNDKENEDK